MPSQMDPSMDPPLELHITRVSADRSAARPSPEAAPEIPPSTPSLPDQQNAETTTQQQQSHGSLKPKLPKIWKQFDLTTTLLCTILMVILAALLFRPQTLAVRSSIWANQKEYHDYCVNLNVRWHEPASASANAR
jgi:hypothetical protein